MTAMSVATGHTNVLAGRLIHNRSAPDQSGASSSSHVLATHVGDDARKQAIQLISGTGMSMKQRHEALLQYLDSIKEKSPELQEVEKIVRG